MKSPNNGIQRPQTSESMINIENNISQNDKNTQNIETFLNEEHFYTIEMKRFKSLFVSLFRLIWFCFLVIISNIFYF